jgi:hypothetical protein
LSRVEVSERGFEVRIKLLAVIFIALLCAVLPAQEFRATISGHVFDSSSGAVPGAKIEAVNVDTNETTTANTDASGAYTIPFLRPGNYKLLATASGFKQNVREGLILEAAKVVGIDIRLEVGALTETVQVTAEAAMLETQSASRGGVVTTQQVAEMPLNARNPFMLGAMMAGVTFNGAAIWQRPFDNGAIAQWSMNGGRDSSSEFMLDGASNDGQMGSNNVAYVPIVDAVQEFNVMQNMYNSEYGHTGSGIMNVVLKSGTNTFHGSVYEFMRRTQLDANTFQNNAIGKPKITHYLDQYGFELEGPARVPGLLKKDGPVKLFYMGAFENYREGTPNPLNLSYPEPEMRTGDFSKMVNSSKAPIIIYDPFTSTDGGVTSPRQPFPGNIIPSTRINPIAAALTKYMPLPNQPAPAGFRYANNNLVLPDYFDKDKFYNLILKFDWNFGSKHRAFFRHGSNDRTEDRTDNGIDNKPGTTGQQPFQRINDAYVADWLGTITPTFILNGRVSYNRFIEKGYGSANDGFDMTSLGFPKSLISQLPNQDKVYFGRWNFDNGYGSLGRGQSNNYTDTYQAQFSGTKVAGSHTIKAGVDIRQQNYEIQNTGDILSFTGNTSWTQRVYNTGESNAGDGYASFLLGLVSGSSNYPLFPWWKQYYGAIYGSDDWKVSRKLTLNLGVRWDLNGPQFEKWGRQNAWFDPTVASPIASQVAANVAKLQAAGSIPADLAAQYANLANLKGGITFAGANGIGHSPYPFQKGNFEPRFGWAYQISEKMVFRGGFGQYHSNPSNDYQQTNGFSTSTNIVNSNDGGRTPIANVLSNPYPTGILSPTGSTLGAATFVGKNPSWFDPNFQNPSVWQYSVGFQYQVRQNSTVEASYVGSRSYNLNMSAAYNNFAGGLAARQKCNYLEGGSAAFCNANVPNPFQGIAAFNGTGDYTATTITRARMMTLYPQFAMASGPAPGLSQLGRNDSTISYDSLQVNYNLRMRSGLSLMGNYTFSKQVEEWGWLDRYTNLHQNGLYYLDRPHVFKLTAIYDLPFGEGKHFGAGAGRFTKRLISGWQWTTFFVDPLSGYPANLPGNAIMLKDPGKSIAGGYTGSVDWKAYQVREWNPCVLKQDPNTGAIAPTSASIGLGCGTDFSNNWGNYAWLETTNYANDRMLPNRSGQIRVHHAFQMDASLLKRTKINERMSCQFGFEAFNLMNHNYYGRDNINTSVEDSRFGSIIPATVSTQNILPRQIQVRFKFNW